MFPGKLGMLTDFMEHFAVPITQGGYANASQVNSRTIHNYYLPIKQWVSFLSLFKGIPNMPYYNQCCLIYKRFCPSYQDLSSLIPREGNPQLNVKLIVYVIRYVMN